MDLLATTRLASCSLCLVLAGCAAAPTQDAQLAKQLIGKWSEVRQIGCNCDREEQALELRANGTFRAVGVRRNVDGSKNYSYGGEWKIQDGYFCYRVTSAEPQDFHSVGEERRDRIVSITDWEWVTVEQGTGRESRAWRFPK
jgi:hypothetical protein